MLITALECLYSAKLTTCKGHEAIAPSRLYRGVQEAGMGSTSSSLISFLVVPHPGVTVSTLTDRARQKVQTQRRPQSRLFCLSIRWAFPTPLPSNHTAASTGLIGRPQPSRFSRWFLLFPQLPAYCHYPMALVSDSFLHYILNPGLTFLPSTTSTTTSMSIALKFVSLFPLKFFIFNF